ncbi:MAG: type IX secretion system membrane protein PorP/SprF [Chitinophagales bacterium]|nr:type IX secretion system membrane protein PorP/SprF [Chitinophagales bacterium]
MKKTLLTLLGMVVFLSGMYAQQDAAYSMYMFNGLFVNPAYAGSREVISVMGIYRHQWVGIDGAPRTANISVHTPFRKDQYALGLTISNDRLGLSNNFSVTPAFAYRLRLPRENRLCFGIQTSFNYFYQNNGRAILPTQNPDNSFNLNENLFVPNVGFGIYAYGLRYFVGVSAPHLMPSSLTKKTRIVKYTDEIARVYNFYVFTAGYVFGKDASVVKFRPTILVKWQKGLPKNIPQFDANLALLFIDRLWIGAGYRTETSGFHNPGQAIIAFAQFKVTPQLQVGYAYDAEISGLRRYTSGTHEIMLGYDFWFDKKRFVTPRFIKYF